MNFYYGADKIPWDEFLVRSRTAAIIYSRSNAILAMALGLTYMIIGKYYWSEWMVNYSLWQQAIWILSILICGPVCLGIGSAFIRMFVDRPRCPACGKRLHELLPTIASKRCPHCNNSIISDPRGASSGYELPLTIKEGSSQSSFTPDGIKSMRTIVVGTPLVALLFFSLGISRNLELEPLMEKVVQITGGAMIAFCGIAPLISVSYVAKILHRIRLMPKNQSAYCPECGDIPSAYVTRMTGNCSECGARLLASPDESVSEKMVDWHKLKRYCRWSLNPLTRIVITLIAYPLLVCIFITKCWSFLFIAGAIFCLYQIVLFCLRRQAAIPKKCPHCESSLTHFVWTLLYYGRCPNCHRKLVRDGDDGQGGDHA